MGEGKVRNMAAVWDLPTGTCLTWPGTVETAASPTRTLTNVSNTSIVRSAVIRLST